MKIILEETAENLKGKRRVEIEWDQDDMDIYEFREKLLEPAMLAWTYHPSTIAELFGEHSEELNVEVDYDTADKILVEALKEQYSNISRTLEQRCDDTKTNYGMFHNDKEEDIVEIKKLLNSFEDVLRYNMLEEDFKKIVC